MQPTSESPTPTMLGLGVAWTRVGYGVLLLAILAFVLNFTVHPLVSLPPGAPVPAGYRQLGGKNGAGALLESPLGMIALFEMLFSAIFGFVWTLVDVVDRRKRFVWLMPMFVCPLIGVLHALPLALYLFHGRETPEA